MLLIDAGNSRIKWARVIDDQWVCQGVVEHSAWSELAQSFAMLTPPHKILVSNVAGDEVARQLRLVCKAWHCPVEFAVATEAQCGVRNAYEQPARLGSDRWASLIAAWHHERAASLVVNCGTATTIDTLSGEGVFLGGLILPGIGLMRRSLAAGTAQLGINQENRKKGIWHEFPRNTEDAMVSGAIQATTGAIRQQFALLGEAKARCLISGGAVDAVLPHLGLPLLRMDNLVLQGLQIIGKDN